MGQLKLQLGGAVETVTAGYVDKPQQFNCAVGSTLIEVKEISKPGIGMVIYGSGLGDPRWLRSYADCCDFNNPRFDPNVATFLTKQFCEEVSCASSPEPTPSPEKVIEYKLIIDPDIYERERINRSQLPIVSVFSLFRNLHNSKVPVLTIGLFGDILGDQERLHKVLRHSEISHIFNPFPMHMAIVFRTVANLIELGGLPHSAMRAAATYGDWDK